LRAEARGHVSREIEFVATEDTLFDFSLSKSEVVAVRRRTPARPEPAPKPAASPARSDKTETPPATCNNPFFIAEGGIKRVRPECH
jgi:hypothetical protein